MLKIIQCRIWSVVLFTDVSGSCTISVKLTTPSGTFVHISSGDTGAPSAAIVNLFGMMPPSSNPFDVRVSRGFVGAGAAAGEDWAGAGIEGAWAMGGGGE